MKIKLLKKNSENMKRKQEKNFYEISEEEDDINFSNNSIDEEVGSIKHQDFNKVNYVEEDETNNINKRNEKITGFNQHDTNCSAYKKGSYESKINDRNLKLAHKNIPPKNKTSDTIPSQNFYEDSSVYDSRIKINFYNNSTIKTIDTQAIKSEELVNKNIEAENFNINNFVDEFVKDLQDFANNDNTEDNIRRSQNQIDPINDSGYNLLQKINLSKSTANTSSSLTNSNIISLQSDEFLSQENQKIHDSKNISSISRNSNINNENDSDFQSIINQIERSSINNENTLVCKNKFSEIKIDKPFDYQLEIFENIKNKNAIVFMETGKGKTFISIMLIKHLLELETNSFKSSSLILEGKNKLYENINKASDSNYNEFSQSQKLSAKEKVLLMASKNREKMNLNKTMNLNSNSNLNAFKSKKKIIFLVCEVVLVDQQSKVIEQNIDECFNIKVALMNSSKKFSRVSSNIDNFIKFWEENNIFVSTPSIIYKLLSIGYINISQIDLLIFDECHHADGNHPYNLIMTEFYFFHKENPAYKVNKLPQILGLTASPLKKKIEKGVSNTGKKALEMLCENLDSVMVIDPEVLDYGKMISSEEDDIQMLSLNEAKRVYFEIPNHKCSKLYPLLKDFLLEILLYPIMNYCIDKEFYLEEDFQEFKSSYKKYLEKKLESENLTEYNKVLSQLKHLHEVRKKSILFAILEKLEQQIFMIIENLNFVCIILLISKYIEMLNNEKVIMENMKSLKKKNKIESKKILELKDIDFLIDVFEKFAKLSLKHKIQYESPRLAILLRDINGIIKHDMESNKDHRVIIFVANRIVSEMLSDLLNSHLQKNFKSAKKIYSCVSVVGVNKRKNESSFNPSNSLNKMNENVKKFKNGTAQILVGTSTVEEGIDVRSCDFVIVYTELKTAKSYIQMKGRARKANATFSIYTDNIGKMQETISDFVELILFIRNQFKRDSIVTDFKNTKTQKKFDLDEDVGEFFYIEKSKAKITIRNAAILYNEFIQQLKSKDPKASADLKYFEERKPHLNGCPLHYRCQLIVNSIYFEQFEYKSEFQSEKNTSSCICYVMLFLYLYNLNKLDDSFKLKTK